MLRGQSLRVLSPRVFSRIGKVSLSATALACGLWLLPRVFAQQEKAATPPAVQPAPQPVIEGYVPLGAPIALGRAPGMKMFELGKTARNFRIRLAPGDEVMSALAAFTEKYQPKTSTFIGVGGLSTGVTGWTDPDKRQLKKNLIDQKCEVLSLTGEITINATSGKLMPHAHIVVGYADGSTRGGHLIEGMVAPFMDIFVSEMENN